MQRAVQAGNVGPDPVDTAVVVSPPAARTPTIVGAIGAGNVVRQHPGRRNRQQRAFVHIANVRRRRRHVVDDVDVDRAGRGVAVGVGHHDR